VAGADEWALVLTAPARRVLSDRLPDTAVTVAFGDDDWGVVEPMGGAVAHTDNCLRGPIVVTFKSGRTVELAEAACPGQRLLVRDESVELGAQNDG